MKRLTQIYIVDMLLAISFLVAGITGIFKLPQLNLIKPEFAEIMMKLHDLSGIMMIVMVIIHFIQHWKWIVSMTKQLVFQNEKVKKIIILSSIAILTIIIALIIVNSSNNSSSEIDKSQTSHLSSTTDHSEIPQYKNVKLGGCPYGVHDDPLPGLCNLYKDKNNNGECDYGE